MTSAENPEVINLFIEVLKMSDVETITYPIEQLTEFVVRVFEYLDIPKDDARLASEVLATSDLRGIDSHGVARLHSYFGLLRQGRD